MRAKNGRDKYQSEVNDGSMVISDTQKKRSRSARQPNEKVFEKPNVDTNISAVPETCRDFSRKLQKA